MSAAFRPAGFWLKTVQGYWLSDSVIATVEPERTADGVRYIAHFRDSTKRLELDTASYLAAFGEAEGRAP